MKSFGLPEVAEVFEENEITGEHLKFIRSVYTACKVYKVCLYSNSSSSGVFTKSKFIRCAFTEYQVYHGCF